MSGGSRRQSGDTSSYFETGGPGKWYAPEGQSASASASVSTADLRLPSGSITPPSPPQTAPPAQALRPGSLYNNQRRSESAMSLSVQSVGVRRYSEISLSEAILANKMMQGPGGHNESMASLLPPPNNFGRGMYEQGPMSYASFASYDTEDAQGNRLSSMSMNDLKSSATIVRLHDRDDSEQWKGIKRYAYFLAPFIIIIDVLLYLAYLTFRFYCNIDVQRTTGISAGAAWIFVAAEFLITIPYLLNNGWALFSLKTRNRPRLRLMGNMDMPTVDVFITCCKEDNDVIMDTCRAACDQDYPMDRFRVIVLDDGKSDDLKSQVEEASRVWPNLLYMSREKKPGVPHHFKAGNLNYGLDQILLLPGGSGEFVAALDADMIPEPHWLRAVLPHLCRDRKVAMACPPQLFYNTPRSDPLGQSLDFFNHVTEPIKDTLDAAWCTGSGYICRRAALDDIGGIPVGGIAEDVATSNRFIGRGWITCYVHEPLQFGTVPEDFSSHLKQRTRWALGTVENAMDANFYLFGERIKHMSTRARLSSFIIGSLSFYPVLTLIALFSIPVMLILGRPLIVFNGDDQFRWLLRGAFATVISRRVLEFILYIPAGYHTGQRYGRYHIWMSPYLALSLVRRFILPKWLGGSTAAFKPTGSLGSTINERDAESRKNLFVRLWFILVPCQGFFHLLFTWFVIVGATITTYKCFIVEVGTFDIIRCLITHAWWPPLTWIFLGSSMWTPIAYAISPPTVPDREELLNRDPVSNIAHPRQITKKIAFGAQAAWFELEYTVTTLYTTLCFAATFFYF